MSFQFILLSVFSILLVFSCAKKQEYEAVYKVAEQTNRLTDYDTDSEYIYNATNLRGKRDVGHKIMPFLKGKGQVVKLRFEKQGLVIYMEEKDLKFKKKINETPIFTIPGSYKDYRCAENSQGECTNQEEENTEITWDKKGYFTPDIAGINFSSSFDPIEFVNQDPCLRVLNTKVANYEIKKGHINFELEKEFAVDKTTRCLNEFNPERLEDLSFKFRFFYSLVRYNELVDPKFTKTEHVKEDQRIFGYFVSKNNILNEDFLKDDDVSFMNKWSNNKKTLVYYLSDSFNEKNSDGSLKYKAERKATHDSITAINSTFDEINMPFRIELRDAKGKKAGDIRYNFINLITGPAKHSTLGYGPTTMNPRTGEIIHGMVNMYYGTFRNMVPSVYRHMVEVSKKIAKPRLVSFNTKKLKRRLPTSEGKPPFSPKEIDNMTLDKLVLKDHVSPHFRLKSPNFLKNLDPSLKNDLDFLDSNDPNDFPKEKKISDKRAKILKSLTENSAYPMEYFAVKFNGKGLIPGIEEIEGIKDDNGILKTWKELEHLESEKKLIGVRDKVRALIMPYAWRKTLIHEIGHNLGLRHNFKGSYDKKFFNDPSNKDSNKEENNFSSIMDYGHSLLNSLPNFGFYDKAALNFGYNRNLKMYRVIKKGRFGRPDVREYKEFTLKLGEKISTFKRKDKESGKSFLRERTAFCTDEHIGTDPSCNRFDEGGSYEEILKHYVDKYNEEFNVINFKNERISYNIFRHRSYFWRRNREFSKVREVFEAFEELFVKHLKMNNLTPRSPKKKLDQSFKQLEKQCSSFRNRDGAYCTKFRDMLVATHNAGDFLLNILKTPPFTCLASPLGEGVEKASVFRLSEIYYKESLKKAPKSCFDKGILDYFDKMGMKVHGERGRYLYSLESNETSGFSSDLGAIGIWIDKLLAIKYLVGRRINMRILNDTDWNFIDLGGNQFEHIDRFLLDLAQEQNIYDGERFKNQKGEKIYVPKSIADYSLNDEIHGSIPRQFIGDLIYGLKLPFLDSISLNKKIINSLNYYSLLLLNDPKKENIEYLERFSVKKIPDHKPVSSEFYEAKAHFGNHIYLAKKENLIATVMLNNISLWNKIFNNNKVKTLKEFNDFKNVYWVKSNPFYADEDRNYVRLSRLKGEIRHLKLDLGEEGKRFEDLDNLVKVNIYNKIEELRKINPPEEFLLDEELKEHESLIKHFVSLNKEDWKKFSNALGIYNSHIVGINLLEELEKKLDGLRRNRESLKLLFDAENKPYQSVQLYHIAISLNSSERRRMISELKKSDWRPSSLKVGNKSLLDMKWDEMKDLDKIISVDDRSVYDNIVKKLISY